MTGQVKMPCTRTPTGSLVECWGLGLWVVILVLKCQSSVFGVLGHGYRNPSGQLLGASSGLSTALMRGDSPGSSGGFGASREVCTSASLPLHLDAAQVSEQIQGSCLCV